MWGVGQGEGLGCFCGSITLDDVIGVALLLFMLIITMACCGKLPCSDYIVVAALLLLVAAARIRQGIRISIATPLAIEFLTISAAGT